MFSDMNRMDAPFTGNLRIWEGWTPRAVQDAPDVESFPVLFGIPAPADYADRLYICEALDPACRGSARDAGAQPYTLEWFLNIENQRLGKQGRWIPKLLEFAKHSGETLLGLGNGLGTDWLQFAKHGADVTVCSPSVKQLSLIRRNFELRGLPGRFLHASSTGIPLESASIDVVCVSSLLQEVPSPQPVVEEIYRVLKPGGKVLAVTPAKFDVDFWLRQCFPWRRWFRKTDHADLASAGRFSRRELRRLFGRFVEHRIHKRHLRRREVPHLWRWAPLPLLERLMGHVLILKAFKPLSSAMPTQAAA
jgi:ubiquinone/menaquinone biosynthesis C-methylase UbiE